MLSSIRSKLAALALPVALFAAQSAHATLAWALVTNPPSAGNNSRLYTFDTATPGNFTLKGDSLSLAGQFPSGLDFDNAGNLFASTNLATNFLTTINPNTGAASNPRGSGLAAGFTISDLSWDRLNNRMLALATQGVSGTSPQIYQLNTTTGAATFLGTVAADTDGVDVSLAVRADGQIFLHGVATDRWYSVNPNTFVGTPLGLEGVDTNFGQGGTFDHSTTTLYHAAFNNTSFAGELWSVNQVSGAGTFLGAFGTNLGLSTLQITDMAIPVPEPTCAALLGLGGVTLLRRRR